MGIGSILVGVAVALIVGAYLARPFRVAKVTTDLDQAIETWVAFVRAEGAVPSPAEKGLEPTNFCHQCGRRVVSDDRFCAGCGTLLRGGTA